MSYFFYDISVQGNPPAVNWCGILTGIVMVGTELNVVILGTGVILTSAIFFVLKLEILSLRSNPVI